MSNIQTNLKISRVKTASRGGGGRGGAGCSEGGGEGGAKKRG